MGDIVTRDPNVVDASKVHLIDWSVLLTPFVELQPAIAFWQLVYAADDRQAW